MGELLQYYEDGMNYFTEGNLNKAFNHLTLAVAGGLENEQLNTAIALMLVYRGEFEEAYKFFILNNKKYKDAVSERYLSSIDEVNNCIEKHNLVVNLIEKSKYDEALVNLVSIRSSGFRTLNDDILMCYIYCIKKDYKKCKQVLEEIYLINKEEVFYYEMKNYLEKKDYTKLKTYAASIAAMVIIFSTIAVSGFDNKPSNNVQKPTESKSIAKVKNENEDSHYKLLANLTNDIMKEDLYDFWINDKNIDASKLDEKSKNLYDGLKEKYNEKAETYFYKNGLELYKSGNYKKSFQYLSIAYENMKGNYLDEHIIFYIAKAAKDSGNEGAKYYREYLKKYPKGCYIQECLYDLAIIDYKNNNIKDAKRYASIIVEEYSNTMYNNDKIRAIMD